MPPLVARLASINNSLDGFSVRKELKLWEVLWLWDNFLSDWGVQRTQSLMFPFTDCLRTCTSTCDWGWIRRITSGGRTSNEMEISSLFTPKLLSSLVSLVARLMNVKINFDSMHDAINEIPPNVHNSHQWQENLQFHNATRPQTHQNRQGHSIRSSRERLIFKFKSKPNQFVFKLNRVDKQIFGTRSGEFHNFFDLSLTAIMELRKKLIGNRPSWQSAVLERILKHFCVVIGGSLRN